MSRVGVCRVCEDEFLVSSPRGRVPAVCSVECRRVLRSAAFERVSICSSCGVDLPGAHGGRRRCEKCVRERQKEHGRAWYRRLTPEELAHHHKTTRVGRYGLTPEQWDAMLAAQGGVCAACGSSDPGKYWHTDHCHETGVVRGILCLGCNTALGHLCDSVERLDALRAYLERSRGISPSLEAAA